MGPIASTYCRDIFENPLHGFILIYLDFPQKSGGTFYHTSPYCLSKSLRTIIGELKPLSIIESLDRGKEAPFGFLRKWHNVPS
jgi:hypothetical protein